MTPAARRPVLPWQEDQVFTFPERDGWVFWAVGLDGEGLAEVAEKVPGGTNNNVVLDAVRALDEDALEAEEGAAWGAGIWFPADHDRQARAGVLVRTFPGRGDPAKAYRKFRKQAARVPQLPGLTISGYNVEEGEVDLGPFVLQAVDTVEDTGEVRLYWHLTFFGGAKDEVVRLEFQTVYAHLVDRIEDEIIALIENAYYAVRPGSELSKELGPE